MTPLLRWFVVHAMAHREAIAAAHLERQDFRSYLPRHLKTVRHARKLRTVLAPYFPGYLFVELDLERQRWRSVHSTQGVLRLVMSGDYPAPVPVGLVEALIGATDEKGVLTLSSLGVGQRVRMVAGPFAEQLGRIQSLDDSGRVRVLLEIMGGYVPAVTHRDHVVRID
jgi:transcriptional antiterminator RfaH